MEGGHVKGRDLSSVQTCDTSIVRFNNLLPVEYVGGLSKVFGVVRVMAGNEMITRETNETNNETH